MSARTLVATVAVAGLVLAGCGGSDGTFRTSPTTAGEEPEVPAPSASAAVRPQEATVNTSAWYGGFKVTIDTAKVRAAEPNDAVRAPGLVELNATFENLGTKTDAPDFQLDLAVGDRHYAAAPSRLPGVPGGITSRTKLQFEADAAMELDKAVLTIGMADKHQAIVPLGSTGTLVSLEPTKVALSATVAIPRVRVVLRSAELRGDDPSRHAQAEKGRLYVKLTFDVTAAAVTRTVGGVAWSAGSIRLKLPDGTVVAGEYGGSLEVIRANTTKPGLFAYFAVSHPSAGSYQVLVSERDTGAATITLPSLPSAGS